MGLPSGEPLIIILQTHGPYGTMRYFTVRSIKVSDIDFLSLVTTARSIREFKQERPVEPAVLLELIEVVRLAPSAANLQPLKYLPVADAKRCEMIFPTLSWASALSGWAGPEEGKRPAAYIIVIQDMEISSRPFYDIGVSSATLHYAAAARGLGSCIIMSIDKRELCSILQLEDCYSIEAVVALGYPDQTVAIEPLKSGRSVNYYRTKDGVHHVPKRSLKDILIG